MILANSDMISRYPAQLYYSALPLLPSDTYVAGQYPTPRGCISVVTGRENSWTPLLFTLPRGEVAAFSPRGPLGAKTPPPPPGHRDSNRENRKPHTLTPTTQSTP